MGGGGKEEMRNAEMTCGRQTGDRTATGHMTVQAQQAATGRLIQPHTRTHHARIAHTTHMYACIYTYTHEVNMQEFSIIHTSYLHTSCHTTSHINMSGIYTVDRKLL